jgi:hypothetical protein
MRSAKRRSLSAVSDPLAPEDPVTCGPVQVLCGPQLCRLRVWDEAGWAALPARERPSVRVHVPGLGWVGAEPVRCLN